MREYFFTTNVYAFTSATRGPRREEIWIDKDGDVFVLDPVADAWTRTHILTDEQQDTLRRMARVAAARNRCLGTELSELTYGDVHPCYAVVCFGSPTQDQRGVYNTLRAARRAKRETRGGSCTTVQILGCATRAEAEAATIHHELPRVT